MALPNFIDRAATAASQVLSRFQASAFKEKLAAQAVGIAFDANAAATGEGEATLDLLVRLLSRLYPKIAIVPLDPDAKEVAQRLRRLAKRDKPRRVAFEVAAPDERLRGGRKDASAARRAMPAVLRRLGRLAGQAVERASGQFGRVDQPFRSGRLCLLRRRKRVPRRLR